MVGFITPAMAQRKSGVAITDAGKIRGEVGQPMGDEMHDLPFSSNAAIDTDHAR